MDAMKYLTHASNCVITKNTLKLYKERYGVLGLLAERKKRRRRKKYDVMPVEHQFSNEHISTLREGNTTKKEE